MVPLTLDGEAARQISRPDEGVGLGPFLRGDRQDGAMCVCEFVCVSVGLRLVIRQPVRLKVRPLAWSLPPPILGILRPRRPSAGQRLRHRYTSGRWPMTYLARAS